MGSLAYCASEIVNTASGTPYDGPPVDIFACGVILHVMLTQKFPFVQAGGKYYKAFMADPVQCAKDKFLEVEDDALDLIAKMIAYYPKDRITVEGIRAHPWM